MDGVVAKLERGGVGLLLLLTFLGSLDAEPGYT